MDLETVIAGASAAVALTAVIISTVYTSRAHRLARRADQRAEAADHRTARVEQRQLERRDVRWDLIWHPDKDTLQARNIGADDAHDVVLWVDNATHTRRREHENPGHVAAADACGIRLTPWANEIRGIVYVAGLHDETTMDLSVGLTWTSPLGVPATHHATITVTIDSI